jgi:predicted RNase H-like nuclease (RuvC/YqgF family)
MTRSAKQWQRNTNGLRSHAQRKAAVTAQRAEAALARLIQEQRPITFTAVAEMAGISTAWLYEHETIKERIMHLRAERSPKVQVKIPPREQASSASKETMIAALRQRIQKLEQENRDLRRQVEVAYGLLQKPAEEKRS